MNFISNEQIISLLKKSKIDEVVVLMQPFVKIIALKVLKRIYGKVDIDELVSNGYIGLVDAIKRFDFTKSDNFKAYAEIRIRGAIFDFLREEDLLPRSLRDKFDLQNQMKEQIEIKKASDATDDEIATALSFNSVEEYYEFTHKMIPTQIVHLEDICPNTEYFIGNDDNNSYKMIENKAYYKELSEKISLLPEKQKDIIIFYYFKEMSLKEIGEYMNLTESRISQLHASALRRLKNIFSNELQLVSVF